MADSLNAAQRDAVETLSGPLLVLAGAGTGKTRVVTYRIAELIRRGTKPDRILAVTFTNKAAKEMQGRATALLGRRRGRPEISTFHSLCVRILRRNIQRLGYPERFAIYDRGEQESVARDALREIRAADASLRPSDLLHLIGSWKSHGVGPERAQGSADTDREHLAAVAYRRYQDALKAAGAVDFDDLLLLVGELFERFARVRHAEAARFDHILIDEYQDTNHCQYCIVKALAGGHRNLCVVGDDDQSIYGWRGAEVTHILRFKLDWPEAKVVRLEKNYRSRPEILEMANRLIVFNRHRHDKLLRASRRSGPEPRILQLQDESQEAQAVVGDMKYVLSNTRTQPRHMAILFRTNEQPRPFETELRRVGLPYVMIGGMSFFDRAEVRDILAYLKLLANPRDEVSLLRIINKPARGISRSAVDALRQAAAQRGGHVWDLLPSAGTVPGVSPKAAAAAQQFVRLIGQYGKHMSQPSALVAGTSNLIEAISYRDQIRQRYDDPNEQESRWGAVEQVVNAIADYKKQSKQSSLQGFLDDIALADRHDDDKDSKLQRNAIALMTLHAAKGLEFPHVYLVGMEENLLPHHRSVTAGDTDSIDEERRLCYVGVTRAQDRLTISLALSRKKWGKPRDSIPSRFLYELTGQADHPNAEAARLGRLPHHKVPAGAKAAASAPRRTRPQRPR